MSGEGAGVFVLKLLGGYSDCLVSCHAARDWHPVADAAAAYVAEVLQHAQHGHVLLLWPPRTGK